MVSRAIACPLLLLLLLLLLVFQLLLPLLMLLVTCYFGFCIMGDCCRPGLHIA